MTYRSTNRPRPARPKCKKHPNINAVPGRDLCKNCVAAEALAQKKPPTHP